MELWDIACYVPHYGNPARNDCVSLWAYAAASGARPARTGRSMSAAARTAGHEGQPDVTGRHNLRLTLDIER